MSLMLQKVNLLWGRSPLNSNTAQEFPFWMPSMKSNLCHSLHMGTGLSMKQSYAAGDMESQRCHLSGIIIRGPVLHCQQTTGPTKTPRQVPEKSRMY